MPRRARPLLLPSVLALAYLVLLIDRFPRLVGWENGNSDMASAYVLTDAVSHGPVGHVVLSEQANWAPLWYGLVTHGLSFHRVLWELSPALLLLAAALLVGWTVSRISTWAAGLLAIGLIVAASPTALVDLTAPVYHNTTIPGVALLGAYLLWLEAGRRPRVHLITSLVALSIVLGTFLASDALLAVVGIVPFVVVSLLAYRRNRRAQALTAAAILTIGAIVTAAITAVVMHALDFSANIPGLAFTRRFIPQHLEWLGQGLLHLGNGLGVAPHSPARTALIVIAAIVTVGGSVTLLWAAGRALWRPADREPAILRDLHVLYWTVAAICACAAYVVTTVASYPATERYFAVVIPAVAATVPLAATGPRSEWILAGAASAFIACNLVALWRNEAKSVIFRGAAVPEANRIEAALARENLTVGYAGYWNAASLDWVSHERLHVYPVTDKFGPVEPMYENRVAAWYRPRANTASYLLLAPGDDNLANRLPHSLPAPVRTLHLGTVTLAIYPYDLAAYLHPPS